MRMFLFKHSVGGKWRAVSHVQTEPVSFTVQEIHPVPSLLRLPHGPNLLTDPSGRAICPRKPSAPAMPCLLARYVRLNETPLTAGISWFIRNPGTCMLFWKSGNWGPERLTDLSPENPSVSTKAETRTQISLRHSCFFPLTLKVEALNSQCWDELSWSVFLHIPQNHCSHIREKAPTVCWALFWIL